MVEVFISSKLTGVIVKRRFRHRESMLSYLDRFFRTDIRYPRLPRNYRVEVFYRRA